MNLPLRHPAALSAAVSFLHALAFACAALSLSGLPHALVLAGIALSYYAELKRLRRGSAALICRADGGLELAGPIARPATLAGSAVPASWLAIVQMRDRAGRRESLIVTPDRSDADAFRRLRVWLRWHRPAESDSRN